MSLQRQVLDSDYRRKKRMASRHIPIGTWLEALNMVEYIHLFHQYGGVEDLIYASEAEIKDLGINHGGHRAKIVSSLRILREKYEKGRVTGSGVFSLQRTPSTSSSAPNSPTAPYPDFEHVIASPEKLQADLQKELAGDPSELRSRPWYHGNISRQRAEAVVTNNGDFLVRDCISKPGDFVLTCKWKGTPLNFMINAIVGDCAPGNLPTVSYQFEEDAFVTIQELIHYYQQRGKPVTVVSGAILRNPIARSMPLSYYDTKYGALINFATAAYYTPNQSPKASPFNTPTGSPEMNRRGVKWTGSQPVLNVVDTSKEPHGITGSGRKRDSRSSSLDRCDSLPLINVTPPGAFSGVQPTNVTNKQDTLKPIIAHMRAGSAPALTPEELTNGDSEAPKFSSLGRRRLAPASSESNLTNPPPPKPSRIPSVKYKQKPTVIVRNIRVDDDDRDYSDYMQVKEQPSWLHGSTESIPKFQDVPKQKTTSHAPSNQPQMGRRANRMNREKVLVPAEGQNSQIFSQNTSILSGSPSPNKQQYQRGRRNMNLPQSNQNPMISNHNNPPPTPTYKIVARSRSFRTARREDDDYDNNLNNVNQKGYQTLPSKKSRSETSRTRLISDTKIAMNENDDHDYDVPRQHAIDECYPCYDIDYMRSRTITKPAKVYFSAITPENFKCDLLPKGHKVLDQSVLLNIKALLLNKSPKTLALHLTKYDLTLMKAIEEKDLGLGVTSGLELLTLPQGKQLRQDVIERWECLRLFTMVTLLTSPKVTERAQILSLWIQTCQELKTTAGNLYCFAAIMSALVGPQIHRLTDTWLILRQNHTSSAYVFDTKLRPAFASLNDGSSDLPLSNVSVPYVTPVSQLLEWEVTSLSDGFYWENGMDPIGVAIDALLVHLDTARVIASQGSLYNVTGNAIMTTLNFEPQLGQALCPEFHLLLLWGDKGWAAKRKDRVAKLEQIGSLLSQKYQVPGDDGTEV